MQSNTQNEEMLYREFYGIETVAQFEQKAPYRKTGDEQ